MTRRFRLSGLLRARQAQEDVAKGAAARARSLRDQAMEATADREVTLGARSLPPSGSGTAMVAALAAQRALAADLVAARDAAAEAEREHTDRVEDLAAAAIRRRGAERLAERHAADQMRQARAADQRAMDEIAGRQRPDAMGSTG
jgi:flagellar protein FliJ